MGASFTEFVDEYDGDLGEWFPSPAGGPFDEIPDVEAYVAERLAQRRKVAKVLGALLSRFGWSTVRDGLHDALRGGG